MPGSGCFEQEFETEANAKAYLIRQRVLAKNRGDDLMGDIRTGGYRGKLFGVVMWYGPWRVWFENHEFVGVGDAEHREGENYLIRLTWPIQELIEVPISQTEPLDKFLARMGEKAPRSAINLTAHKKEAICNS